MTRQEWQKVGLAVAAGIGGAVLVAIPLVDDGMLPSDWLNILAGGMAGAGLLAYRGPNGRPPAE